MEHKISRFLNMNFFSFEKYSSERIFLFSSSIIFQVVGGGEESGFVNSKGYLAIIIDLLSDFL